MNTYSSVCDKKKSQSNVLIVDDHPIIRQGLAQLIDNETDLRVSIEAENSSQAMEVIKDSHPDIAVLDLSMGNNSGLGLIEDMTTLHPEIKILVLSMHDESLYAERCLRAGAKGYIMKSEPPKKVITAIRLILKGGTHLSDEMRNRFLNKFVSGRPETSSSAVALLSNRELEVFQLLGKGMKARKISEQLNLSVKTVETHIERTKKKMNLNSTHEVAIHAINWLATESSR